ncbi:MAG: hypothetical protein QM831_11175 [Kofleriaceae bacterium]
MTALSNRRVSWLAIGLGLILVAITAALLYRGYSFYKLSLEERVEHPDFRKLRPSGMVGNGYGWVAALLIVLNLSYLIRRRFGGVGSMRVWLDIHVFTGLLATVLVSFHSAFQLRTPIATASTASLALVVFTGLIGRFLYALTPTSGRERLRDALDAVERIAPGARDALADVIATIPGPVLPANASLARSLFAIPQWRRASNQRRRAIRNLAPSDRSARPVVKTLERAAAAEARASGTAALLRSWRALHRLFALAMLAAVLLHGGVAWYYGYRWIFS